MVSGVTTSATTAEVMLPFNPADDAVTVTGPTSSRSNSTWPGVPFTSPVTPAMESVSG